MLISANNDTTSTGDVLRLLADPTRRRIVELLAVEQLCTCHLQEELGAKQTLVSHHLRALREAGVVEARPHGRFTYYRLRSEPLVALSAEIGALADRARSGAEVRRQCP